MCCAPPRPRRGRWPAATSRVLVAGTIDRALELRRPGRVLAGERGGIKPPGFDLGNSPAEATERRGDELVLTTTNGAPAIVAATGVAPQVRLACLLNLDASIRALRTHGRWGRPDRVLGHGWRGGARGRVRRRSSQRSAARRTHRRRARRRGGGSGFPTPLDALAASSDAAKLRSLDLDSDITDCAVESTLDVIPIVTDVGGGVATVSIAVGDAARSGR